MREKLQNRYIIWFICGIVSVLSVTIKHEQTMEVEGIYSLVQELLYSFNGWGIISLLAVICLTVFYRYIFLKYKSDITLSIVSFLFALFMVGGKSYKQYASIKPLVNDLAAVIKTVIACTGYFLLFSALLLFAFHYLKNKANEKVNAFTDDKKKLFGKIVVFLFVSWIPYFIILFPGNILYDSGTQMLQYFGYMQLTNKSPYFQTLLIGVAIEIGNALGSANLGIGLYIFAQLVYMISVFSYSLCIIEKWCEKSRLFKGIVCICAFVPIFPLYAVTVGKDINFGITVLLLTVFIFEVIQSPKAFWNNKIKMALFIINLILMCLFRNAGIALVIGCLPIFFFTGKKEWKKIFICYVSCLICVFFWNNVCLPAFDVDMTKYPEENLSIPLQQTARYMTYHEEEITEEEKRIIDKIVDYEVLSDVYNPEISDPVKATYKRDADKEDIQAYISVYVKQFIKHPVCYVEAVLNKSYGYFYPDDPGKIKDFAYFGMYNISEFNSKSGYNIHSVFPNGVRWMKGMHAAKQIPGIGIFLGIGIWTWFLIVIIAFVWKIRRKYLLVTIPAVFILLGCIASPVNAYLRYALPMIFCIPFLSAMCIYVLKQNK